MRNRGGSAQKFKFWQKKIFENKKKRNTIQIKEEGQLNAEEFPIILN